MDRYAHCFQVDVLSVLDPENELVTVLLLQQPGDSGFAAAVRNAIID